ncbi:MAG: hypothetical protein V7K72_09635, partial [Nostoc sp.]|uniref:hypothetical protein n=1 Tax=Nostoc sp. TaxID=1180 RepID=UPI002FFB4F69
WNEAIAADSAITSLRYRCVRNDKYLSRHDMISSQLNHLRYVIASETEWNEAIAAFVMTSIYPDMI